jgi:xylulokinase
VVAIDLGSTGVKVAVVDASGVLHSSASEVLPLVHVGDNGVEQDPELWWSAIGRCSRRAVADSGLRHCEIGTVAVTSQFMSTVAVDTAGRPLSNAIMWMDGRGAQHRRMQPKRSTYATLIDVHGLVPSPNDSVAHIDLIRATRPDVYSAAAAFVEPMDAIAARLTGRVTATQHTVFPMQVCDNREWGTTRYSDELLALSGLDAEKLPPLVSTGEPRGTVTAATAAHLGVAPDAVVASASIDSVTSAVGCGATTASRAGLVVGTTAVLATHLRTKRHDFAHGLSSAPSALPGTWFLMAENGIGGKALDVFANQMMQASYDEVLELAAGAPCGSNGVMFAPWLVGSMAPRFDSNQRGAFFNLGLSTTRAEMARAVLEGVAMNVAWLLPHFATLADHHYDSITLGGGGAHSPLWAQIIADATGVVVRRLANPSTTNAHGAALLALVDAGEYMPAELPDLLSVVSEHAPDAARHRLLSDRVEMLVEFHERTGPLYERLAAERPS